MPKIRVQGLYKIFGPEPKAALALLEAGHSKEEILERTGSTVAAQDVGFDVHEGEVFVLMGLSGSGKSTVLRCLNQLAEPTAGSVRVDGEELVGASPEVVREVRRTQMAMVFQRFGLLPHRSVLENAAFGLEVREVPEEERHRRALEALALVGLKGYEDQLPAQLSGGMQQRVGLARALASDTEVLLMDEAFSALDPIIRREMQDELVELERKLQKTIVFITHDLEEALRIGHRIAIMKDGAVVQTGTGREIVEGPADAYVRAFVEGVDARRLAGIEESRT